MPHTNKDQGGVEETHNTREELIKELRMVANMINMGEKIRWAQETTLMDQAADLLETHHQELQKAREEERFRLQKEILSCVTAEGDDCFFLRVAKDSPIFTQSELDQHKK